MNNDLVSIITPTYNCARFIAETIESVQNQTYLNWEMLIIDDCSSDNTKEIVEQYASKDDRVKYYCLDANSGAAIARNTAIKMAKGRWIAFLDSDDLWKPEKLDYQLRFMKENNIHFSYTQYEEIAETGQSLKHIISGPANISRLGMLSYCWPGCLTVMYDANKIGLIQIPSIKKNNDYAMWLLISRKANCKLLPRVLASYRKRIGSISNANYMALIKWHYKLFIDIENTNKLVAALLTVNNLFWGVYKKLNFVRNSFNS